MMRPIVTTYLIYTVLSVGLTVWVARTLFRSGRAFLLDVFEDNPDLADSINRLLVVGFYLINLGFVSLHLRVGHAIKDAQGSVEALSTQIGVVLLVLGVMHFGNLFAFSRWRRRAMTAGLPPVAPDAYLPAGDDPLCAPA